MSLMMYVNESEVINEQLAWVAKLKNAGVNINAVTINDITTLQTSIVQISANGINNGEYSPTLSSLQGSPQVISGNLNIVNHDLSNFEYMPAVIIGHLSLRWNLFKSLKDIHKHIHQMHGYLNMLDNPIVSHVLGVFMIKGLTEIQLDNPHVEDILNRHIGKGRVGMLIAQEELIEAGLEEFAQL